jgi:enamine deaminase RidA (YjgF/YER057c/UK114 family)
MQLGLQNGTIYTRAGIPVSDDDASQGESLEEGTRQANSNLQRLIEAVGGLLAGSGELLTRLQQILSGAQPASDGSDEAGPPPPTDRSE